MRRSFLTTTSARALALATAPPDVAAMATGSSCGPQTGCRGATPDVDDAIEVSR
jgi:hypothetical protein